MARNEELDIEVHEYSDFGGELKELVGRVPSVIVEALELLLRKYPDDEEAKALLSRLD